MVFKFLWTLLRKDVISRIQNKNVLRKANVITANRSWSGFVVWCIDPTPARVLREPTSQLANRFCYLKYICEYNVYIRIQGFWKAKLNSIYNNYPHITISVLMIHRCGNLTLDLEVYWFHFWQRDCPSKYSTWCSKHSRRNLRLNVRPRSIINPKGNLKINERNTIILKSIAVAKNLNYSNFGTSIT